MDKQTIARVFGFQRGYLGLLVDDIPEARMTEQPKGLPNHPAWQIGHLTIALENLGKSMLGAPATIPDEFIAKFNMGTTPVDNRAAYPSKAELLKTYDSVRGKVAEALLSATEKTLAAPNKSAILAEGLPTVAHMALFMMLCHESNHLGQISVWRQAAGMRPALEPLMKQAAQNR